MTLRRLVLIGGGLLILSSGIAWLVPWRALVAGRLTAMLVAQGLPVRRLTLTSLGLHQVELTNVALGTASEVHPLILPHLTLAYTPRELWSGHLRQLAISGMQASARDDTKTGWQVTGLTWPVTDPKAPPTAIPVIAAGFNLPIDHIALIDSQATITIGGGQLEIPLTVQWDMKPAPKLVVTAQHLRYTTPVIAAAVDTMSVDLTLAAQQRQWTGTWHVAGLAIKAGGTDLPPLAGQGTLVAQPERLMLTGKLASADASYQLMFELQYRLDQPAQSWALVQQANLPWQGGQVAVTNVRLPLDPAQPAAIRVPVTLVHLPINALLQQLTGGKATATGTLSGQVPLSVGPGRALTVHQGQLQADAPGILQLPPDILPGDNQGVTLVRTALQDFHYRQLIIALDNDAAQHLAAQLEIEGSNPALYGGKAVKLNVHLQGDVLDFIRQNLTNLTDPKQLLRTQPSEPP